MSKRLTNLWTVIVVLGLLSLSACGSDAKKKTDCADGAICSAGTGGLLADGGVSGTSGGGSGTGAGTTGSGAAGTNAADGGGGSSAGTSGGAGTGSTAPDKPKADGTQLASCDPRNAMSCMTGLTCYTASGATPVGFCTTTCKTDADCKALGDTYGCSSPTGQGGMQYCRVSCKDAMDTSCPDKMSCLAVQGGFRCLYDAKDIGSGTATAWQMCKGSGDCTGDLVCNPDRPATVGAATYSGACTTKCMMAADCKDKPATGTAMPTCGTGGSCQLSCTAPMMMTGGGATDGGSECPDGMQCVAAGGRGRAGRCLYVDTSGGV